MYVTSRFLAIFCFGYTYSQLCTTLVDHFLIRYRSCICKGYICPYILKLGVVWDGSHR